MKDLMNQIHPVRALAPVASATDNTAQVCQIIDRLTGVGYDSVTYLIATGALPDADAGFTALLEESDDSGMSGATAVADIDLIGTEALASFVFSDDNKCFKLGYTGNKRYTRLTITPANNSSASLLCVIALLGHPRATPTPNPPA